MSDFDFIIYGSGLTSVLWMYLYHNTGKTIFCINALLSAIVMLLWTILSTHFGGL